MARQAVEPLIRQALELAVTNSPWPEVHAVGGWWNRQFGPEIDLVGADQAPVARRLHFVGSIKWLQTPFDDHDLANIMRNAVHVPGFTPGETGLVIVTRSGTTPNVNLDTVDLIWRPEDVLSSWQHVPGDRGRPG